MTRWMGRWLMGVAVIHVVIAVLVHNKPILLVWERGTFNTVAGDPVIGAIVWSLLFGCVAFVGGLAVDTLERESVPLPKARGWCLLALAIVGAILVPASGFWLLFPVALTILMRRSGGQLASGLAT
jgi:hypothetical protein